MHRKTEIVSGLVSFPTAVEASGGGEGIQGRDGTTEALESRQSSACGSPLGRLQSRPQPLVPKASPLLLPPVLKTGSHWFLGELRMQGSWLGAESEERRGRGVLLA